MLVLFSLVVFLSYHSYDAYVNNPRVQCRRLQLSMPIITKLSSEENLSVAVPQYQKIIRYTSSSMVGFAFSDILAQFITSKVIIETFLFH
jgi:hypothetical protein